MQVFGEFTRFGQQESQKLFLDGMQLQELVDVKEFNIVNSGLFEIHF